MSNLFSLLSLGTLLVSIVTIHSANQARKSIYDNLAYMEYHISTGSLYSSEAISKIIDLNFILQQEIHLSTGEILPLEKLLINSAILDIPQDLVMEIHGKYYKLTFDTSLQNKILISFFNITEECEKNIHIEKLYHELSHEKDLLSYVLDNIPVAVWVRDKDMEIIYFNNTYSDLVFGYDKPFNRERLEIDRIAIESATKAFEEKTVKINERAIIVEGKRYLYQITDTPIARDNKVLSVAWNITNKEVIQKQLQEIMLSHEQLLESLSDACMIIGPDKKLKYYNTALIKFWGVDRSMLGPETTHEEILDHLYLRRKLPEQYNYAKFKEERLNSFNNITEPREELFYLPDGKCLRCVVIPHVGNSLLFTYEDVTEKLSLERLNNTLSAVQKFTIDNLQEGICVFNEAGDLELINAEMKRLWKIEAEGENKVDNLVELIERFMIEYPNQEEGDKLNSAFTKAMISRLSVQQITKNSSGHIIHRYITPLPNRGVLVSDLNVTDSVIVRNMLTEQNTALMYIDKVKSDFLAKISYKLRSALTAIKSLAQMIDANEIDNLSEEQQSHINSLMEVGDYLTKLVDDAIEITALDEGYTELVTEEFDLVQFINIIISEFADTLLVKGIAYSFEYDNPKAIYVGDREKIERAMTKLLENAVYRARTQGIINIDLITTDNKYILSITDDGIPMQDNEPDANSATSIGLGVILARAIISTVGGKVTNSFSKDTGLSTVIIELINTQPNLGYPVF